MSHKQLTNEPGDFSAWLRNRAKGHAPGFDIAVYARPAVWLAMADAIDAGALSSPGPTEGDFMLHDQRGDAVDTRYSIQTPEGGILFLFNECGITAREVFETFKAGRTARSMPLQERAIPTREQVAEAIWNTGLQGDEPSWDDAGAWWKSEYLKKADAALELFSAPIVAEEETKS